MGPPVWCVAGLSTVLLHGSGFILWFDFFYCRSLNCFPLPSQLMVEDVCSPLVVAVLCGILWPQLLWF